MNWPTPPRSASGVSANFPPAPPAFPDPVTRRYFIKLMPGPPACWRVSDSLAAANRSRTSVPFPRCRRATSTVWPRYYATYPHAAPPSLSLAKSNDATGPPSSRATLPSGQQRRHRTATPRLRILDLYDPDFRTARILQNGSLKTHNDAADFLKSSRTPLANGGKGLAFLADQSSSPSRARLRKVIAGKMPQAGWYEFEPVDFDIHRQAATIAFGRPVAPRFEIDAASVIVSLDSDFIGGEDNLHVIRQFAAGRTIYSADPRQPPLCCRRFDDPSSASPRWRNTAMQKGKHPGGSFARGFDMEKPPLFDLLSPIRSMSSKAGVHQWGMSIDLSACGCALRGCLPERNNVPIRQAAGRQQAARCHWIRIDQIVILPAIRRKRMPSGRQPGRSPALRGRPCECLPGHATTDATRKG